MSDDTHELDLRLPADAEQVAVARRELSEFAERYGFGHRSADVRLAVSEIVTNAILHGYRHGRAGDVVLHARQNGRLEITVRDFGTGVEPRSDSPGLGMGLAIAADVSDGLDVRTIRGGGAEITLTFDAP